MACPAIKLPLPQSPVVVSQESYSVQVSDKGQPTYGQVYDWLFDNDYVARMSGTAFKVYAALARHKNKAHLSWPGQRKLAEMVGCSLRDIRPALDELVALELITIEQTGQGRRSSMYRMNTLPKGRIMYRHKFKPGKNERGLFDEPGESTNGISVTTDAISVTTESGGQQSVSVDNDVGCEDKRGECPGNETKDYPTGNPNNLSSIENHEKLQKKIQRAERHIHEVNPRLRRKLRYDDLCELCMIYEGNDLATVIGKYGAAAESIALIRYHLRECPTIEDRERLRQAEQRKREEQAKKLAEDKASACSLEQVRQHVKRLRAALNGKGGLVCSLEQHESSNEKGTPDQSHSAVF